MSLKDMFLVYVEKQRVAEQCLLLHICGDCDISMVEEAFRLANDAKRDLLNRFDETE